MYFGQYPALCISVDNGFSLIFSELIKLIQYGMSQYKQATTINANAIQKLNLFSLPCQLGDPWSNSWAEAHRQGDRYCPCPWITDHTYLAKVHTGVVYHHTVVLAVLFDPCPGCVCLDTGAGRDRVYRPAGGWSVSSKH